MAQTLSLTFDDGPDEHWTRRVLDVLDRAGARASFFVVGERVEAMPVLARSIAEAGHDVQLHCHRHLRHTQLSEYEIELDTREALAALALIDVQPTLWRTPWGVQTEASRHVAEAHGLRLVRWRIDTHDWRGDCATTMLAHAKTVFGDGGMVLMHDALGPGALRDGCENTIELISELIAAARESDLAVGPIPQLRSRVSLRDAIALATPRELACAGADE